MGSGRVPSRGCLAALRLWFADLITYSEALTLNGVYVPFTDIGGAVLRMLAATRGIKVSDADAAELTDRFATMPPHPEVPAALRRLRDHGFRLFTLTDNTLDISGRHLPDRLPRLGHDRRCRGRLAGWAHPPRGQRPARRGAAADLYRAGSRCDRRPADRAVPSLGERVGCTGSLAGTAGNPQVISAGAASPGWTAACGE